MSAPPAHDLGNLIKWISRDEWRRLVEAVMAEHFGPAMEVLGLTFEEIDDALGGGWARTLWGCAFEDFLTRRFEPDGRKPGRGLPAPPRLEGAAPGPGAT